MSTPSRRKRVVRDGSAPKRRSATLCGHPVVDAYANIPVAEFRIPSGRTLPKEVTEAADRLSLLRALRMAARTMLTTTAMDWVRMGLGEAEVAEVMEGLAQEFKAAARKKGSQGV